MYKKSSFVAVIPVLLGIFLHCSSVCSGQSAQTDTTTPAFRIMKAIEMNDGKTVAALLAADPALINTKEPGLDDPLLVWAARKNQPAMIALLVKSGADIRATNRLGSNALHLAAFTGDYDMMELLINSGADWKERNQRGKTPVDYVCMGKNPRVFELFLKKDKEILKGKTSDGATLLHLAANAGDTLGFIYLLGKGLDINAKDNHGTTVTHQAIGGDNPGMLVFLQRHGADLNIANDNGYTPLFWAILWGNKDKARFLLDNGADVNYRSTEGTTPLLLAAQRDSLAMVELLASHGAGLKAADNDGRTALHFSTIAGNLPVSKFLAREKSLIASRDKEGMTPLHLAAIYGNADIGKTLLEKGADPLSRDKKDHDAAYYCHHYGNTRLLQILAQKENKAKYTGNPQKPVSGDLARGQAVIHYLNHSGYAIETTNYLLVFDYFQNQKNSSTPSLLNGKINPAELRGKKVIVFSSHEHGDHYDTAIWEWRKSIPGIAYVMGFRPATDEAYEYIGPRETKTIDGVVVHAIRSTDAGVGLMVEADGLVTYHPGDHVNKSKTVATDFKEEIDYLTTLKKRVDIAFFPVEGCGFPDREAVKAGNDYVVSEMKPGICIAMHGGSTACSTYTKEIRQNNSGQPVFYGVYPGDRFTYPPDKNVKPL